MVFKSVLKIGLNDVALLTSALLEAVQHQTATLLESNQYGIKYAVEFTISHQNNTAMLKSVWMVRCDEVFAR